jgi:hypothetical protein
MGSQRRATIQQRARRDRVIGATSSVGAFLTFGLGALTHAPAAAADIDDFGLGDVLGNIFDSATGGADAVGGGDPFDGAADAFAASHPPESADADNGLFGGLFDDLFGWLSPGGDSGGGDAGGDAPENASVPLHTELGTEPVTDVSVNGGADTDVLVDTGSNGLMVPIWDMGLQNLGLPDGIDTQSFSGGANAVYLEFPDASVDFGADGPTAEDTDVDVVLFTYPSSLSDLLDGSYAHSINEALGGSADGILGVGPNAAGPDDSNPTDDLPGDLSQGLTIDQSNDQLIFGPDQDEGSGTTVDGSPLTDLYVDIGDQGPQEVTADVDSGGVNGTMPSDVAGDAADPSTGTLAPGTDVSVYANESDAEAGQDALYSYTVGDAGDGPTVTDSDIMNTGNFPFAQGPIHIGSEGDGTTTFHN